MMHPDNLNGETLAAHISRMYAAGIRAFLPAAGTSEFHSLSADELVESVRITHEASGPDAVVFAPVGLQTAHAIDVAVRSMEAGATGIMFMPFVHPYLSDSGARDYYETVIQAGAGADFDLQKRPYPRRRAAASIG